MHMQIVGKMEVLKLPHICSYFLIHTYIHTYTLCIEHVTEMECRYPYHRAIRQYQVHVRSIVRRA